MPDPARHAVGSKPFGRYWTSAIDILAREGITSYSWSPWGDAWWAQSRHHTGRPDGRLVTQIAYRLDGEKPLVYSSDGRTAVDGHGNEFYVFAETMRVPESWAPNTGGLFAVLAVTEDLTNLPAVSNV